MAEADLQTDKAASYAGSLPPFVYRVTGTPQEQYRSALQRTARALKREQGKHLLNLRQELEQLKVEYMARQASPPCILCASRSVCPQTGEASGSYLL